jgi:glutamate formiminotransferase
LVECVINISEGRDRQAIDAVSAAAGDALLDIHSDHDHNRSVLTLVGEEHEVDRAARSVAQVTVASLDMTEHSGVHPRIGALDVVPWVAVERRRDGAFEDGPIQDAVVARNRFAHWAGDELSLPCFLYGPERSLPEVRRRAWVDLEPDTGPRRAHPSAGATAVGARPILVAYNLWLADADLGTARAVASSIRGPSVRSLGLPVGQGVQVSCNLIAPSQVGPGAVFDAVASQVEVQRAELVGLLPASVLDREPQHRWMELGLDRSKTIEARLEMGGPRWGKV